MTDTKLLTAYQQGVLAERADEADKIKKLDDFIGSPEWLALGSVEHSRILLKIFKRNETLKVINEQIGAFDKPQDE